MKQWYIHINGENIGPMTEAELLAKYNSGEVTPNHLVWTSGFKEWVMLKNSELISLKIAPDNSSQRQLHALSAVPNDVKLEFLPHEAYGGFWARFVAWGIDHLVLLGVNVIVAVPVALQFRDSMFASVISSTVNIVMTFLYFAVVQAKYQGTPGKHLMGLVLLGSDMRRLTPTECFRRYIYFSIASLPLWAGIIAAGTHSRKQGWHDRWSNTIVVKRAALTMYLDSTAATSKTRDVASDSQLNRAA